MSLYGTGGGGAWAVLKGPGLEKCPKCGYDLRGLMQGVKCPECGTDTARHEAINRRTGRESPLGAAPRGYLALLALGFILSAGGWAALFGLTVTWILPGDTDPRSFGMGGMGAVAIWGIGQWLVTMPRPRGTLSGAEWDRHKEWAPLRWLVRGSIVLGAAAVGCVVWRLMGGPSIAVSLWGLCASTATAASCWYMARVSDWAPDDGAAWRYRAVAWATGFSATSLGLILGPLWFGIVMYGTCVLIYAISGAMLVIFQLQSANMVRWAIRNMDELRAREERIAAKAERERVRGEAERARMEAVSADRLRLMEQVEAKHRAMQEASDGPEVPMPGHAQVIERGSGDTYGIEGEGESPRIL